MMEAMVRSALDNAEAAEHYGLRRDQIILCAKVSGVRDLIDAYSALAARTDHALHLGLTEAGMGMKGIVASTAGLAPLLLAGIGDTIRVSLTPAPGGDRSEEVRSPSRFSSRSPSAPSPRRSPPAPAAAAPPAPTSRSWRSKCRATSARPCRSGGSNTPEWRR